jgi:hypothetical protein
MAKGRKTGGGSRKGIPNKITKTITEALDQAFDEVGGAAYLKRIAEDEPRAFCALLGKRLPATVNVDAKGSITVTVVTGVPDA